MKEKMGGKKKDSGALLENKQNNSQKRKSRDEDCCSINFLKCVLHIFNVVFMFGGLAVLGVGVWTIVSKHRYVALLPSVTYPAIAYMLAAAGALAAPLAALGCCGLKRENRTSLLFYTYFLLISFLLEAGGGALAYYYEVAVEGELRSELNSTFLHEYQLDEAVTSAVDAMQVEFRCCGAVRFEDWRRSAWLMAAYEDRVVPDSCCKTVTRHCGVRDHPSNIHYNGCIRQFTNHIREHLVVLAAVGVGMSVIPIFGFIFSCCLYVKIKHVDD